MKQRLENEQFNFLGLVVGHLFLSGRSRIRLLRRSVSRNGLWRLGTLVETRYGQLKENETITIQAKRFTATITRTPSRRVALIKKVTTE